MIPNPNAKRDAADVTPLLTHLREQIDTIDDQLLALLEQRYALTDTVGGLKQQGAGVPICPKREDDVLGRLTRRAGRLSGSEIHAIWRNILSASAQRQRAHTLYLWAEEAQRPALLDLAHRRFGALTPIHWASCAAEAQSLAAAEKGIALVARMERIEPLPGTEILGQYDLDGEATLQALAIAPHTTPRDPDDWHPQSWQSRPRRQQPSYAPAAKAKLAPLLDGLRLSAPVVEIEQAKQLADTLATIHRDQGFVLQLGDCAERIDASEADIAARIEMLAAMRKALAARTGVPVTTIARMGGQFAKPRSAPLERHGARHLPVYRGDAVNGHAPCDKARRADPARLQAAYDQSRKVAAMTAAHDHIHLSHEGLLLDYESALVRRDPADGRHWATSAHTLWLGARTAAPDEAHVEYLRGIANPIGIKVGPDHTPEQLEHLLATLDPDRTPGKIMLVPRFGAAKVEAALPAIAAAVHASGHPVLWLADPCHGNTHKVDDLKTRAMADMLREISFVSDILDITGERLAGLHLETTPEAVDECVERRGETPGQRGYASLCDPRLSIAQAMRCLDLLVPARMA